MYILLELYYMMQNMVLNIYLFKINKLTIINVCNDDINSLAHMVNKVFIMNKVLVLNYSYNLDLQPNLSADAPTLEPRQL